MTAISRQQIVAIHALKSKAGLDDDSYRAMLANQTGQSSAKALTGDQAFRVISHLRGLSGELQTPAEADLNGPYGALARALWISGWHLGVVDRREDAALLAFVKRQTGIDHLKWVRDAGPGAAVVEALKAMLARDGGVNWPTRRTDSASARKRAVIGAQLKLLGRTLDAAPAETDLHQMISDLGRQIRARQRSAQA